MARILNLRQEIKKTAPPAQEPKNNPKGQSRETVKKSSEATNKPERLAWKAPSFYFNPQKKYLAGTVVILVGAGMGLLIIRGEILTSIFLFLSSLVLILQSTKKPEIEPIVIDERGITTGERRQSYQDLRSFWIHYQPGGIKELSLESKKWYMPYIKISIGSMDPLIIRSFLINFIPEKEQEYSLVEIFSRKMGI